MSGARRILLVAACLGLGASCVYVPYGVHRGGTVVVSPPPGARWITRADAVNIGWNYCQSRRIPCDLQEAHLTGNGVWKVKFKVRGWERKGHVRLEIDGRNGAILDVDQKLKERGDRGRHGRDHDDD